MKRSLVLLPLIALFVCTAPRQADAKIIEIWGSGIVGGAFGNGNADSERDFFNWASGGAGGIEVGVRFLFLSAYIDYLRFFGGDAGANLISFNFGGDSAISLTKSWKLVLRLSGTFYYGTLDSASRPDATTAGQVNTRGIGVRGGVGIRYQFWKVFSFGVTPQVGYHYFFGGAGQDITDTEQNSHGYDLFVLGYFRVGIGF
jgi:hypothetical protein